MKTSAIRNRRTGQYSHNNEKLCTCGRTKGVHNAAAPYAFEDYTLDERVGLPGCEAFKNAKVFS